jgi:hypothetical protein
MRHDWIFSVLSDLRSYAEKNDLPEVAIAAANALVVAQAEITALYAAEEADKVSIPKRPN